MRGTFGGGWWVIVLAACGDGGTQRDGTDDPDSAGTESSSGQGSSDPGSKPDAADVSAPPGADAEGSAAGEPGAVADPAGQSGAEGEAPDMAEPAQATQLDATPPTQSGQASEEGTNERDDAQAPDTEPAASEEPAPDPRDADGNDAQAVEPPPNDGEAAETEPAAPQADPGDATDSAVQPLSFEADIWPVFERMRDPVFEYYDGSTYGGCNVGGVCHGGERPGAGLRMPDPISAYDNLVGAASASGLCDGSVRVVPGDPEQSCLIQFYRGRLQYELEWVDDPEIELVERWISDGALP